MYHSPFPPHDLEDVHTPIYNTSQNTKGESSRSRYGLYWGHCNQSGGLGNEEPTYIEFMNLGRIPIRTVQAVWCCGPDGWPYCRLEGCGIREISNNAIWCWHIRYDVLVQSERDFQRHSKVNYSTSYMRRSASLNPDSNLDDRTTIHSASVSGSSKIIQHWKNLWSIKRYFSPPCIFHLF